jgi:hypothetical protein
MLAGQFYGVPLAVWLTLLASVLVGILSSATTIIVMWRSNANSRKNLHEQLNHNAKQARDQLIQDSNHFGNQLDHDERQRNRERAMALRRDVYLPAADALAHIQLSLGHLTDLNADQMAIGRQLAVDLGTLAKTHLVASEATVRALMIYQKALMPAYTELVLLRAPLLIKKAAIDDHQKYIDRADAEIQRIVQLMKQHNISGNTDKAAFDRLVAQSTIEQNARKNHSDKQLALHRDMGLGQIALAERMAKLVADTASLIPDAIIFCRQELELPIDPVEYRNLYAEQQGAAKRVMTEAIRRGREMIAAAAADKESSDSTQSADSSASES